MSPTFTTAIAKAAPGDARALSAALARAFHDDPVFGWVIPDAAERRTVLPSVFAAFAEVYLAHDETYLAPDGAGAAMWAPAGVEPVNAEQAELLGSRMAALIDDDALGRVGQLNELLDQHHPAQPCDYLQFVGVVPEHQGRGLGSELLTPVLRRCDAASTPAYLEATSVRNRRLYERQGFDTVGEIALPEGPTLWPMWRDPAIRA